MKFPSDLKTGMVEIHIKNRHLPLDACASCPGTLLCCYLLCRGGHGIGRHALVVELKGAMFESGGGNMGVVIDMTNMRASREIRMVVTGLLSPGWTI